MHARCDCVKYRFRVGRTARRFLASVLLMSVATPFASSGLGAERLSLLVCHYPASTGMTPAFTQPSTSCDHSLGAACATMIGCASVTGALIAAPARITLVAVVGVVASASVPSVHGRLVLGPPTPPPNG